MKVNITKTFGQFAVAASTEISDAQAQKLIALGALYIFERQPSSAVEQKVFGPMLDWEQTERGTYKRPAKFERGSVAYAKDVAEDIKATYNATPGKLGDGDEIKFNVTSITQHEIGEGASAMVRATTFVDALMGDAAQATQMRGLFKMLGMAGADDASRDSLIAFAHEKKMGIQPAKAGK